MQAVEILSLICASAIFVGCQALDLRIMHLEFLDALKPVVCSTTDSTFSSTLPPKVLRELRREIWSVIPSAWGKASTLDTEDRCEAVISSCVPVIMTKAPPLTVADIKAWTSEMLPLTIRTYKTHRHKFFEKQTTQAYLGRGAKALHTFVREDIGVPFHEGLAEHPRSNTSNQLPETVRQGEKKTIGSWVSIIYEAVRDGRMQEVVVRCLAGDTDRHRPGAKL